MNINLPILEDELSALHPCRFGPDSTALNIDRVRLLPIGKAAFDAPLPAGTLLVARASDFDPEYSDNPWCIAGALSSETMQYLPDSAAILMFPDIEDASDLFACIQDVMDGLSDWYERMLSTLASSTIPDLGFYEIALEYFKNPLMLLNPSGLYVKLIGQLPEDFDGQEWLSTMQREPKDSRYFGRFERDSLKTSLTDEPYLAKESDRYNFLETIIVLDNSYYGKICHCDACRPFTLGYISMAKHLQHIQTMATSLARQGNFVNKGSINYLTQCLSGHRPNEKLYAQQLENIGWDIDEEHFLIVAATHPSQSPFTPQQEAMVGHTLTRAFPRSLGLSFNGEIVVAVKQPIGSFDAKSIETRISKTLQKRECLYAFGLASKSMFDLGREYEQCSYVLGAFNEEPPSASSPYYGDCFFEHLAMEHHLHSDRDKFVDPRIRLLHDYDRRHGTDYIQTLVSTIECQSNKKESAKALFIHPNTLAYRLKKIEEIAGISIDDAAAAQNSTFHLLFSAKLLAAGDRFAE